jgi:hypothetical protein
MISFTGCRFLTGLFAAAALLAGNLAHAAGFEILAPHRAIYDLKLDEASERSGIQSMNGRIVYEISGNECDGMTVRYRFVSNIATNENSFQTDQQTTTFESADGKEFTFLTRTYVDDHPQKAVRGTAIRTSDGLKVELVQPDNRQLDLPDAAFISAHLISLIENAGQGVQFVKQMIYDGSEDADEVVNSSAVIGTPAVYDALLPDEVADAVDSLRDRRAWPVTVSYFDRQSDATATERLPSYEASFLLYENGISRNLTMRYDDYSLSGQLSALEMLPNENCDKY